ncbi:helix-turn-helix domain-containing protein [Acholeplasma laidlawii]|uniref:helix-turn-helix domain-containing protein n=1 Tax=Acholeplasma laidlawii TaxID=2148 RepID=UPI002541036E|nr:helix-turn-helix transcriptional regulator [Acholeplasma laidlawii]
MYINLGYLRGQIRLRNPEITNNSDNIGSMLKHHRLKLNLTLEDSSDGICSVSYLSKIENSLIRPSEKYILQLEERYNTKFFNVGNQQNELLHQLIENIFHNQEEVIDERLFTEDNYQSKLNKTGYLISQNKFLEAKINHQELNPYIKNLNGIELKFYIFLTSKLLSFEGRLKDAFSVLNIETNHYQLLHLDILIACERIYLATKMNHHPYIVLTYESLIDQCIENEFYHKVHELKYYYLTYMVQFINEQILNELLDKSKNLKPYQKAFVKSKYHFINMDYELAIETLNSEPLISLEAHELKLLILNRINQTNVMKDTLNSFPKFENKQLKLIHTYLVLKYSKAPNIESLVQYILTEVLKSNDLPDDILYLNFWYEEGLQCLKKVGYYKDATKLGRLIFRKIKDLTTIFD